MGVASKDYGSLLIPVIMTKLPSDLRLRIARETQQEVWNIDELMTVIKVEVEARETSEGVKFSLSRPPGQPPSRNPSSPHPPPSTASALLSSNLRLSVLTVMKIISLHHVQRLLTFLTENESY